MFRFLGFSVHVQTLFQKIVSTRGRIPTKQQQGHKTECHETSGFSDGRLSFQRLIHSLRLDEQAVLTTSASGKT